MEDNIKMYLQAVGWGVNWIYLPEDKDRWRILVNSVRNSGAS
jgi:hypothetical protein